MITTQNMVLFPYFQDNFFHKGPPLARKKLFEFEGGTIMKKA